MVAKTFRKNARIHLVIALVIALAVLPAPVYAEDIPSQPQVDVYEMPMPVPALPAPAQAIQRSDLPEIRSSLPTVSSLPSQLNAINAAGTRADQVMSRAENRLDSTLSSASARINQTRELVDTLRARVGSPQSDQLIKAQNQYNAYVSYTAYDVATTMQGSIYTSTAYLRGLSNLGSTGLNLTFVILGLGWIGIINLLEFLVRISAFILRIIGALISWTITLITALIDIINAVGTWLDAIIPG